MRYLLVINPEAQLGISRRTQKRIINLAESILGPGEVFIIGKDREKELEEKFEVVIFCGGDGTLNRGVRYIIRRDIKIGIIPLGSGVDFASALKIPRDLKRAFGVIARGKTKRVDLGIINGQPFVNTTSFGFDAFINHLQEEMIRPLMRKMKALLPVFLDAKWCYVFALFYYLAPWIKFVCPSLTIETESFRFSGKIHLLAITNSFRYGGGFRINPQARLDDGILDACLALPLNKLEVLKKIYPARKGTHIFDPKIVTFQFERMSIKSEEKLLPQADGESLPPGNNFEIRVIRKALEVFVP